MREATIGLFEQQVSETELRELISEATHAEDPNIDLVVDLLDGDSKFDQTQLIGFWGNQENTLTAVIAVARAIHDKWPDLRIAPEDDVGNPITF